MRLHQTIQDEIDKALVDAQTASVSLIIPKSGFMYSKRRYLNTLYCGYYDTHIGIVSPKMWYYDTTNSVFRYPIVVTEFNFGTKSNVLCYQSPINCLRCLHTIIQKYGFGISTPLF